MVPESQAVHGPPSVEAWRSYEAIALTSVADHVTTKPSSPWVAGSIVIPAWGPVLSTRNESESAL